MSLLSDSALAYPFSLCLFSTAVTYIASVLTSNVSQVDRLWTFLPTIYTAYFALAPLWPQDPTSIAGIQIPFIPFLPAQLQAQYPHDDLTGTITFSPRALLILTLINLWMIRLSYNTFRRGLFSLTDEDYRWSVLRRQFNQRFGGVGGQVVFQIVNLTFIAATQNVLLMGLGWPAYLAVTQTPTSTLVLTDYLLGLWALGVLVVEFTADNQQFVFQTYKHTLLLHLVPSTTNPTPADHTRALRVASAVAWPGASPEPTDLKLTPADARRGFITSGLWRYSRHPNFACEQAFWWLICAVPAFAGLSESTSTSTSSFSFFSSSFFSLTSFSLTSFSHPSSSPTPTPFLPALLLSLLFLSSTAYTESISASKYPLPYSAYQSRVPMFGPIPLLGLCAVPALISFPVSIPVLVFFPVLFSGGWKDVVDAMKGPVGWALECGSVKAVWWRFAAADGERGKVEALVWGGEDRDGKRK